MALTVVELTKALNYSVNNIGDINDPKALSLVKDEVVAFNELLFATKGTTNGMSNREINVLVNTGDALPVLFQEMVVDIEDTRLHVKVTEIRAMRWVEGGGIQVNILGEIKAQMTRPDGEPQAVPADVVVEEKEIPKPKAKKPAPKHKHTK